MAKVQSTSWSWRHAIISSGLEPTTRHVLLTISCFMNDLGGGCYPTTKQLEQATGLSERSVCTHIARAESAGWLTVTKHGLAGRKWKNHEYEARWPDAEGTEARSVPQPNEALKDVQCLTPRRTERRSNEALKDVQSNSPYTTPIERERARDGFDQALKRWPVVDSPKTALKAWNSLSLSDRIEGANEIERFVAVNRSAGRKLICSFAKYLGERMWKALPERTQPRAPVPDKPAGPSPFERKNPKWNHKPGVTP
ncbi:MULTISPECIES: helix-turn-helix domain-containing protein [unclassified Mesorhizobium]|uniref:helix-turn-helix domain-containing protein n=1 Tax=unclassified Mesorhizobium TaxID=325217 RepID=UPI0010926700|nr:MULTISPECIES: helix-turn-helix domain-containing protein [unclassified Mesorhizobium]TGQ01419.1 helix-turn-helix domain-containing protein [Mesorhizobium sp. M8A.F.Ca.ET.218.01.1.1]TGT20692.1 helix-turn-helix domain-containing protein [Mesorhizobium sp. M8A.F.Ca.ET.213.01.1.1]